MKKVLNIPYYSQNEDIKDERWKNVGCGIACLKMITTYFLKENSPTMDQLLNEGVFINGFKNNNWSHLSLSSILRNHGLNAYNQEFRSHKIDLVKKKSYVSDYENRLVNSGVQKIVNSIEEGNPVIVSVYRYFEKKEGGHLVVITGFKKDEEGNIEGLYYHEPNSEESRENCMNIYVDTNKFKEVWRKLSIFVY